MNAPRFTDDPLVIASQSTLKASAFLSWALSFVDDIMAGSFTIRQSKTILA
jgi:hypothetical protein